MSRSTDVKESIAGYYYQILLACRELSILAQNEVDNINSSVAIEMGSDVKIFMENNKETSIEAKFYKQNGFNKKSIPIIHTIYNFHNDFRDNKGSDKYIFSTNVSVTNCDSDFFNNWPKSYKENLDEYIFFVKQCIVRESIKKNKNFKDKFSEYKKKCELNGIKNKNKNFEESFYTEQLIEDLFRGLEKFEDYSDIIDEEKLKKFVLLLNFKFSGKSKFEEINSIKNDIKININKIDNELNEKDSNIFIDLLIDMFLKTTVSSEKIKVSDFISEIKCYKDNKEEYANISILNEKISIIKNTIDQEFSRYMEELNDEIMDENIKNILCNNFIEIIEVLYKNINDLEKIEYILGKFSLDYNKVNPQTISNIAKILSIWSFIRNIDISSIDLFEEESINNIILNKNEKYCFKETASTSLKTTERLIQSFIENTQNDIASINGQEIVVFNPMKIKDNKEPCNFSKEDLEIILVDISRVRDNFKINELYGDMSFRCTKCLEIDKDNILNCNNKFKEGCLCKK